MREVNDEEIFFIYLNHFFTFTFPVLAQDQSLWLEPGVGIGKLKLGDSIKDVIAKLGPPADIRGNKILCHLEYPSILIETTGTNSLLRALKSGKKISPDEIESTVNFITIYGLSSKTRGNLSIGSTLKNVVEVFGDTQMRTISQEPLKIVKCASVDVYKFPENRPSMLREEAFSGHVLTIHYDNEGINFHFKVDDKSTLRVFAITIANKKECMALYDSK